MGDYVGKCTDDAVDDVTGASFADTSKMIKEVHNTNSSMVSADYVTVAMIVAGWVVTLIMTRGTCMPDKRLMEGYVEPESMEEEKDTEIVVTAALLGVAGPPGV